MTRNLIPAIRLARPILLAATLALGAATAHADDTRQTISFPPGASSSDMTGTVKGDDTAIFTLDARAGQTMDVQLSSTGSFACIFNVSPPDGPALFNGSVDGSRFTGKLPADGTYEIDVFQMRAAILEGQSCRFTLSVSID